MAPTSPRSAAGLPPRRHGRDAAVLVVVDIVTHKVAEQAALQELQIQAVVVVVDQPQVVLLAVLELL